MTCCFFNLVFEILHLDLPHLTWHKPLKWGSSRAAAPVWFSPWTLVRESARFTKRAVKHWDEATNMFSGCRIILKAPVCNFCCQRHPLLVTNYSFKRAHVLETWPKAVFPCVLTESTSLFAHFSVSVDCVSVPDILPLKNNKHILWKRCKNEQSKWGGVRGEDTRKTRGKKGGWM